MKIKRNLAISESGFMFDPETGDSYSLNGMGAEILNLLKKDHSVEDIIGHISKKYDCDEISIEKDFWDFTNMLRQYQLIEAK